MYLVNRDLLTVFFIINPHFIMSQLFLNLLFKCGAGFSSTFDVQI